MQNIAMDTWKSVKSAMALKKSVQSADQSLPNYFHPNRTQPFLITFFQAVCAFKRVCKLMKIRLGFRRPQDAVRKRTSTFRVLIKRSRAIAEEARVGKPVLTPSPLHQASHHSAHSKVHENSLESRISGEVHLSVEMKVTAFRKKHIPQSRAEILAEKLDKMMAMSERHARALRRTSTPKTHAPVPMGPLGPLGIDMSPRLDYFKNFAHAMLAEEFDDSAPLAAMEYLTGSAIYFGATIAFQARHGGFLSFNSTEVKASAHKILGSSRLVVKKSEDLTSVQVMSYGDALWLQAGANFVLGATYGSLVDKKRQIQPALVGCKRQSMFKAQQYGRWIILNKDDPMGTLGHAVCHQDRIILEQEWAFLASSSPYESSMYKAVSNSDDAMNTKLDLFQPIDECTWRIHLVALPSEDKDSERQRQKLLHKAKDQIDRSQESRYKKSGHLLTSLANNMNPALKEDHVLNEKLAHKKSAAREQEHLRGLYNTMAEKGFETRLGTEHFLSHVYGQDSPIVKNHTRTMQVSMTTSTTESVQHLAAQEDLQKQYWSTAARLLVPTESWLMLPKAMEEFYTTDHDKKISAARILQKWVRKYMERKFDYQRTFRRIDSKARGRVEDKVNERRRLILEHTASLEQMMNPAITSTPPVAEAHNNHLAFNAQAAAAKPESNAIHIPSPIKQRKVPRPVKQTADEQTVRTTARTRASFMSGRASIREETQEQDRHAMRQTIVHALASYFPVDSMSTVIHSEGSSHRLHRPISQASLAASASLHSMPSIHQRPATAGMIEGRKEGPSTGDRMRKDRERLGRSVGRDFGLPADAFSIPVMDAYERNPNVGLRYLRSMSKPGMFDDVKIKQRPQSAKPFQA